MPSAGFQQTSARGITDVQAKVIPLEGYQFLAVTGSVTFTGYFVNERGRHIGGTFSATLNTTTPQTLADLAGGAMPVGAVGFRGTISGAVYYDTSTNDGGPLPAANNRAFILNPSWYPQFPAGNNLILGRVAGADMYGANAAATINANVTVTGQSAPSAVFFGQTKVSVTSTAVVLGSSQALARGITVKAPLSNAGVIYVGGSGVTNTGAGSGNGLELNPGESSGLIQINNVNLVYINGTANDWVGWSAS